MHHTVCGAQGGEMMSDHQKMRMELRRGVLVLAVLATLRQEHYGYSLRKALLAAGLEIDEGTLYPMIRRLESYGLLTSEWRKQDARPKRYYRLSEEGSLLLQDLIGEWQSLNQSLEQLLENKK